MARAQREVLREIGAFTPDENDDWRPLLPLLDDLPVYVNNEQVTSLLRVFERFPESDGNGVFWDILHLIEAAPAYEPELIRSITRSPTQMSLTMANRLLNSDTTEQSRARLLLLLRTIASDDTVSREARHQAKDFLEYQLTKSR